MYKILIGVPAMGCPKEYLNNDDLIIDKEIPDDCDIWNDFELLYNNGSYHFSFETMLGFEEKDGYKKWIRQCLDITTDYMNTHGYDTTKELDMYKVFTEGCNVNTKFKDIETAYAWLKFAANGFNGSGLFISRESEND